MKDQASFSRDILLENKTLGYRVYSLKFKSSIYIYIYIKNSSYDPATQHSNVAFSLFLPLFINFFYCYPIDHSNLFLLSYKFSIFYLLLLSFFYCYPIDHSNFFLLLYKIWVVLDNQTNQIESYSLQNGLLFKSRPNLMKNSRTVITLYIITQV